MEKYGITLRQWRLMYAMQGGKCKICKRPPKLGGMPLVVDHQHTGKKRVRGLLDWLCNHRLLGRGLESPELHRAAADYLESDFDARLL